MFQTAREGAAAAERPDHGQPGDQQAEDEHQASHGAGGARERQSHASHLGLPRSSEPTGPSGPGH